MKKYLLTLLMSVCILTTSACGGATNVTEETVATTESGETAEENSDEAEEEAKATEAAKAEEEAKATEAAKAEETVKATEAAKAEEAAKATEAAKELLADGLAEDVDRTQIKMFDEPKTMYVQKNVNVRKGPDTKYDRVDNYGVNKEVSVLGQYGEMGWYLISYGEEKAFISNNFVAETEVDLEALRAQQEAEALAAVERDRQEQAQAQAQNQAQTQPAAQPAAAAQPAQAPAGILFIGDSRCVQMQAAVGGGGCSWICENAKGYDWFASNACPRADECVGKGTKVVICLGVNDTGNVNNYAALANQKAAEWAARGAKTYFVSVNPVWENPYTSEDQVINFNNSLPGQLAGIRWIDTHTFLENNGYRLVDGLHYDTNTYVTIFNAIVGSLK